MEHFWARVSGEERDVWSSDWTVRHIPWRQYLKVSILPALAAIAVCFTIGIGQEMWSAGGILSTTQLEYFVRNGADFCLLNFIFGMIIAFCTLMIIDQHDRFRTIHTLMLAGVWSVIFALLCAFVVAQTYGQKYEEANYLSWLFRETVLLSMPAALFFLLFAALIEWTEDKR